MTAEQAMEYGLIDKVIEQSLSGKRFLSRKPFVIEIGW